MPRSQDHIPGVLAGNARHYELLMSIVEHYAAEEDTEYLLRAAMLAANYAWWTPVGLLSDLRLERAVVRAVRGSGTVTVDGDRRGGRVLHVLSEAHAVGGHTRLAWRWMDRDERTSDVVLTNQSRPVPDALAASVRASGGDLHDLRSTTTGLFERARALRAHMDRADIVVLHVNPYDVVALAAANLPGPRPPVIYENHADLGFWLGVGAADVLCDLRPAVHDTDVALRRVPQERIAVLPMPVDAMTSTEAPDLRRRLRIRPDAVVAVTVSDGWKVAAPEGGRGMHDLVDKLLHFSPQLTYVLVGVAPGPQWDRLSKRDPGRVHVVGRVPDAGPYLALADLYLESYPTFAGTSPLEAAMLGLPVVGLADVPGDDPQHLFQRWSPGLAGRAAATTAGQLALAVRRLVADPELRRRDGAEAAAAVRLEHENPGWRNRLEALYEKARAASAADVEDLGDSPTDEPYAALLLRAANPTTVSHDPRALVMALGDMYDATLECDLQAALFRGQGSSIQVRVAPGWADRPAWTARLLELAATRPRLRVSMPFLAGDDVQGTLSVTRLTELLATNGRTTDDCGDIGLETSPPRAAISLPGELVFTDEALDRLDKLAASPMWDGGASARGPARELAAAATG